MILTGHREGGERQKGRLIEFVVGLCRLTGTPQDKQEIVEK